MAESGQTIFYCDKVGFQRLPDTQQQDLLGMPIIGSVSKQFAFVFADEGTGRQVVIPISDDVRKVIVEAMRRAPLEVVTNGRDPVAS